MNKWLFLMVLMGSFIHVPTNASRAQAVLNCGGESAFAQMGAWLTTGTNFILINLDPAKRAIVCRVGFQPFAVDAIWQATQIPKR